MKIIPHTFTQTAHKIDISTFLNSVMQYNLSELWKHSVKMAQNVSHKSQFHGKNLVKSINQTQLKL